MTIAPISAATMPTLESTNEGLARLAEWVEAARNAHQLVAPLVGTPFVPDAYKPRLDPRATAEQRAEAHGVAVANATAAVLQGISLGLDPLQALQQIYVVHGRPGMYAKAMVALVQSKGHEVWTEDESDTRVVVAGRRRGTDHIERVTVTMDQARRAGWTSNQAYTKTPRDMLWNRAAARVCDRIASDAIKGIASVEEIQDTVQVAATVGNGTRTVAPRTTAVAELAAAPEPPLDEEPTGEPAPPKRTRKTEAASDERPISTPQQKKMHALLNETGRGDREVGLVYIAGIIGREITTTKELTAVEAGRVIEALESPDPDLEVAEDATATDAPWDDEPTLDDGGWPEVTKPAASS